MTPQEEIERIKKDYAEHWHKLEAWPGIQKAIADVNPTKLSELAARIIYGNRGSVRDLNPEDRPPRRVVSVNKAETGWMDIVYVKFHEGNHVDVENFLYPDDEATCKGLANLIGAKHSMNPAKTRFFFRHPNWDTAKWLRPATRSACSPS